MNFSVLSYLYYESLNTLVVYKDTNHIIYLYSILCWSSVYLVIEMISNNTAGVCLFLSPKVYFVRLGLCVNKHWKCLRSNTLIGQLWRLRPPSCRLQWLRAGLKLCNASYVFIAVHWCCRNKTKLHVLNTSHITAILRRYYCSSLRHTLFHGHDDVHRVWWSAERTVHHNVHGVHFIVKCMEQDKESLVSLPSCRSPTLGQWLEVSETNENRRLLTSAWYAAGWHYSLAAPSGVRG